MSYWPVSARWLQALQADIITPYVYIDVYENRFASVPMNTEPLKVLGGTINIDSTASVRRTMSQVTFINSDGLNLVPNQQGDLVFPNGTECIVYCGFQYSDAPGDFEVAPQGRFLIEDTVTLDASSGDTYNLTIAVDGSDRMASIARNEWDQAYTTIPTIPLANNIASSGTVTFAGVYPLAGAPPFVVGIDSEQMLVTGVDGAFNFTVLAANRGYNGTTPAAHTAGTTMFTGADTTLGWIVQDRLPLCPMRLTPSTTPLAAAAFNVGDDPTALLASQALAAGDAATGLGAYEVYFDQIGTFIADPIPDPAELAPSAIYSEGVNCVFTELQRTLSNKGVPNWIIVISQGSGVAVPLRGDWQDTNPGSATFIGSPIGTADYPVTVQSVQTSACTTQDQVDAMAQSLGQAALGIFDGMQVTYFGDPAMDAGAVVLLTRNASKLAAVPYVMQQGTLDLSLGVANMSTLTGYKVIA